MIDLNGSDQRFLSGYSSLGIVPCSSGKLKLVEGLKGTGDFRERQWNPCGFGVLEILKNRHCHGTVTAGNVQAGLLKNTPGVYEAP